ncbi:MAG: biotin transporter BioY [Armatimonadetes bacterium]|nr:biotin transporter BioY [Armatimonadota bacterium]MDW8028022.1 biotin transporter BioY [Armatimonadota bacterium]
MASWLKERTLVERLIVLGIANLLLIACSQVRIPLPFTPVPITGQTFGVLLLGALLGSRYGTAVVIAYVFEGAIGLPVFAGWKGGLAVLLGPTGGYIFGFIFASLLVSWLIERGWSRRFDLTLIALLLGNVVIYAFGLPWLAFFVGWHQVLQLGLLPFLFGDLLKLVAVASVLYKLRN